MKRIERCSMIPSIEPQIAYRYHTLTSYLILECSESFIDTPLNILGQLAMPINAPSRQVEHRDQQHFLLFFWISPCDATKVHCHLLYTCSLSNVQMINLHVRNIRLCTRLYVHINSIVPYSYRVEEYKANLICLIYDW